MAAAPVIARRAPGRRGLAGCSPQGRQESDTTRRLHFLSIVPFGEGNGNPLQCSCLENPMDGGAWWAAVYGGCRESYTTEQLTHTHTHTLRRLRDQQVFYRQ